MPASKSESKKPSKKKASKKASKKSDRTAYLIKKYSMREYAKSATDNSIGKHFFADVNDRLRDWVIYVMKHVEMLVEKKCEGATVSKDMLKEAMAVAVRKEFVAAVDKTVGKKYELAISESVVRSLMKSESSSRISLLAVIYMCFALVQRYHEIVKEEIKSMEKEDRSTLNVCHAQAKKKSPRQTSKAATPSMKPKPDSDVDGSDSEVDGSDSDVDGHDSDGDGSDSAF